MRLPALLQFRVLKLAVKSLFSRPFTTEYPAGEYEPIEQFRGRPRYDEENCIGCGVCAEVCPSNSIDIVDDIAGEVPRRVLVQHLDTCICCGQCEKYCTTEEGIALSNEYDHVGFSPEDFEEPCEKKLLLCESCGCVIAPVDQIRWVARRIGTLAYTNPTLMLVDNGDLQLVDRGIESQSDQLVRADRISIQCPRCRRKTALAV